MTRRRLTLADEIERLTKGSRVLISRRLLSRLVNSAFAAWQHESENLLKHGKYREKTYRQGLALLMSPRKPRN
jgi:hypothetical protein